MKNNLTFSVNKENNTILVKREFAAELPLVWDAYTKSEILGPLVGAKTLEGKNKNDGLPGRRALALCHGRTRRRRALVVDQLSKILVHQTFTGVDGFADAAGNINKEMPQSKWEVIFSGKGDVTQVEIHISFTDLAQLETTIATGFEEGLGLGMENLDALLPSLKK